MIYYNYSINCVIGSEKNAFINAFQFVSGMFRILNCPHGAVMIHELHHVIFG